MKSKVGKNIAIIGASSGIGLEVANTMLNKTNRLILGSRKIENINFKNSGFKKNIDVSNEKSVSDFFSFIENEIGVLDSVVNCAGYVNPQNMLETSLFEWEKTLKVNLTGTFLVSKYATRLMKNYGGRIINIASTAGLTARPGWSAYASSKSGVISFSQAIAEELKFYNMKVFIICPGRTATPLRRILAPNEDPKSIMQPQTVAEIIKLIINGNLDSMENQPIMIRERF